MNDEIGGLGRALPDLRDRLVPGGTIVIIAYHSGEDRLVKNAFREWSLRAACARPSSRCAPVVVEPLGELLDAAADLRHRGGGRAQSARAKRTAAPGGRPRMAKRAAKGGAASGSRTGAARPSRGRTISILLLGFVLIGMGVIYRRTVGLGLGRDIHTLEQKRVAAEARRVQLEAEINDASSRSRLVPIAQQRLHMHLPGPDQMIQLPRAPRLVPPPPPSLADTLRFPLP